MSTPWGLGRGHRHGPRWRPSGLPRGGRFRPERVLYGTDFPNLPYAWDRAVRTLAGLGLREDVLAGVLGGNALRLYGAG